MGTAAGGSHGGRIGASRRRRHGCFLAASALTGSLHDCQTHRTTLFHLFPTSMGLTRRAAHMLRAIPRGFSGFHATFRVRLRLVSSWVGERRGGDLSLEGAAKRQHSLTTGQLASVVALHSHLLHAHLLQPNETFAKGERMCFSAALS